MARTATRVGVRPKTEAIPMWRALGWAGSVIVHLRGERVDGYFVALVLGTSGAT